MVLRFGDREVSKAEVKIEFSGFKIIIRHPSMLSRSSVASGLPSCAKLGRVSYNNTTN